MQTHGLVKEVEAQNKIIQKLTSKIGYMEETLKKLCEKAENLNDQESSANEVRLNERVQMLENEVTNLNTKQPSLSQTDITSAPCNEVLKH